MASADMHIKIVLDLSEEDRAILNYLRKQKERAEMDKPPVSYIMTGQILPEAAKELSKYIGIRTPFRPESSQQEEASTGINVNNVRVISQKAAEETHDRAARD